MAIWLPEREVWTRQPNAPVTINRNHPLLKGHNTFGYLASTRQLWTPGLERVVNLGQNRVVREKGIATDFADEGYYLTESKHFSSVSSLCGFMIIGGDRTYLLVDGLCTLISTRSGTTGWSINRNSAIDGPGGGGDQGNLTRITFTLQGKSEYQGAYVVRGDTAALVGFAWTGSRWKTWIAGVPQDDIATSTLNTNTQALGFGGMNGTTLYDWIDTCHAALLVDTDLGPQFQRAVADNCWQFFQ